MIRDTIIFVLGVLICFGLLGTAVYDYYLRIKNKQTISDTVLKLWVKNKCRPVYWLFWGLSLAFPLGLILGFILGHLLWPQFITE